MNKKITVTRGNPYKDRASAVAWERGCAVGRSRKRTPCPYKTPALQRAWGNGRAHALVLRRKSKA